MLVREWMTPEPISVTPSTPLIEAYRILSEYEIRHLPVLRSEHVVGIVTDHDLGRAVLALADAGVSDAHTVQDVMTHAVETIGPDDDLTGAAMLMHNGKFSALPVVENGKLAGILTINDLLEALISVLTPHR